MIDEDLDDPPDPCDEPVECVGCGCGMRLGVAEKAMLARGEWEPLCDKCWRKGQDDEREWIDQENESIRNMWG